MSVQYEPKPENVSVDADAVDPETGKKVSSSGRVEWPEPTPLAPPRTLAKFPSDVFPPVIERYVTALAESTQTPVDLPGCCVLGVLSAASGGRAVVDVRGSWREPVNVYILPVLPPAARKSAVVSAASKPLYEVEKILVDNTRMAQAEAMMDKEIATKAAEKAKREASQLEPAKRDAKISEAKSAAQQAEAITVPVIPKLLADDITPEAAGSILAEQSGRLAIVSAEAGIFDVMAGRYGDSKIPNLDMWLKGHAGDPVRVDRKGREFEHVDAPAITMLLTAQPHVLSAIARNGVFRGRGLLARFLYSLPESNIGRRQVGTPGVPQETVDAYHERITTLVTAMTEWTDPAILTLTEDARSTLLANERLIEPALAEDGTLGAIAEWGGKLAGAIVRLAELLHLAGNPEEGYRHPITGATMSAAVKLGYYFADHAQAAFDLLGQTGTTDAGYLLDHVTKHGTNEFTIRSLVTELPRGRFPNAETVTDAVAVLADHGWVAEAPAPERKGPGRKPSPRYYVHPEASAIFAQSAE